MAVRTIDRLKLSCFSLFDVVRNDILTADHSDSAANVLRGVIEELYGAGECVFNLYPAIDREIPKSLGSTGVVLWIVAVPKDLDATRELQSSAMLEVGND